MKSGVNNRNDFSVFRRGEMLVAPDEISGKQ